jgi:transcriptional regulator with XRE-family HTH domain
MTLRQLAEATGLSESFLSQFERGLTQGSVASLRLIAEALGINVGDLFERRGGGASARVLREAARPVLDFGHHATKQLLTPRPAENLEVFSVQFEIGGSTGDEQYVHGDSDDSVVFRSSTPHRVVNIGNAVSILLWIISPPTRPKRRGTDGSNAA